VDEYDAVVVGGSVAGCAAATFLGRQGARVALLERSPNENAYKVICTHAIMPCATGTLRRLGLAESIEAAGGLRSHADLWTRRGWVRPRPPAGAKELPYGYNIRRERLDPMIRSLAASTKGVDYLPGATVTELIRDQTGRPRGVRATVGGEDREVHARVVIGADGRDSKVAELAGLPAKVKPNGRFIYFAHYKDLTVPSGKPMTLWNLEPGGTSAFVNDDGITVMVCAPTKDRLPEFREDLEGAFVRYFADLPEGPDLSAGRRVTKIMGRLTCRTFAVAPADRVSLSSGTPHRRQTRSWAWDAAGRCRAANGWRQSSTACSHRTGMSTVRWADTAAGTAVRWPCITG
jgi:menaquinone-9 beta-reductase